eukprot:16041225-Heterocapsa_arctica.AAC.1
MLQELRVDDEQALPVQRAAARSGWSLAVEPAMPTDSGSTSAGVGIAVRSHIGHAPPAELELTDCCRSRVAITHLNAICKGGIFI